MTRRKVLPEGPEVCVECGATQSPNGDRLSVQAIDGTPGDCAAENLAWMCRPCGGRRHHAEQWADPEFRARQIAARNMPDARARNRASTEALWADPEYRAKQMATRGRLDVRAGKSATIKALWGDPEHRARYLAAARARRNRVEGDTDDKQE